MITGPSKFTLLKTHMHYDTTNKTWEKTPRYAMGNIVNIEIIKTPHWSE